ncbi:hypothetical protein I540_3963 [Mycobacteroides abscessus subsp. bolletii 1513]|uniref:Uncharacterized protein n=1 Tax=Mycobacteroides abscessus subsp. bolletii 1513 TaxID=1299321 RepID=X8DGM2_9MYCO|nr:hypothetical protein I540_3963 [Mycobacteroides abscessus subsp. bolletii 1513]
MSGYARSTEQRAAVADHRDPARSAPSSQELLQDDPESGNTARSDPGRRLAAFAAGSVAAIGGIAALHGLYRSGDGAAELVGWAGLLLLAMTALGGGIKLAMWGARPVITALFDRAEERLAEPVLAVVAVGAVIVGALGMWWTFRGGYASWWQQVSGESRWSLSLGVGQMLVAVLAGAALFAGGRYVTGLAKDALTDSGLLIERDRSAGKRRAPEGLWHPDLVAALIGGGLGLVLLNRRDHAAAVCVGLPVRMCCLLSRRLSRCCCGRSDPIWVGGKGLRVCGSGLLMLRIRRPRRPVLLRC